MFNPQKAKIGALLSSSTQFHIPRYQRDYKWGKEEAQELIEDLMNYASTSDDYLFLGTMILEEDRGHHSNGGHHTLVVDGQQRLTTIILLLMICRQQAVVLKENQLAQTILSKIAYIDETTGEAHGPLLVASESIRTVFEYMSKSGWEGDYPAKVKNIPVKRQTNRIKPVMEVFVKAIRKFDKDALSDFLRAIYNSVVIRIDIDSNEDALSIFERTNARGMELEISDLLKNYLFAKKVEGIEEKWDDIVDRVDGTFLRMLKYFYVSRRGYIQKAQLYRQMKVYAKDVGPEVLTDELGLFADFYQICRKPEYVTVRAFFNKRGLNTIAEHEENSNIICRAMQALNEFKVTQYIPPAYATIEAITRTPASERAAAERALVRMFKAFENMHFINNVVCDRVGNEVERFYADSCTSFSKAAHVSDSINAFIQEMRNKRAAETEFIPRFTDISYSNTDRSIITYVFDRFMNVTLEGTQRLDIYNPNPLIKQRNNNIEHFLAVNGKTSSEVEKEMLDNIGNLLIISRKTNSSLGNLSPVEKIERLTGPNEHQIQNFVYVREFVRKYGSQAPYWGNASIAARAKDLACEAYEKIWHFQ